MTEILPAILAESKEQFVTQLRAVEAYASVVHVDVLDGTLFPHMSWADARAVGSLDTSVQFELHLMVENPLAVARTWKEEVTGLSRVIFHAELDRQHEPIIEAIHGMHLDAGLALNPETPVEEAHHAIHLLDELLLMTVHPGASGQGIGDPAHGIHEDDLLAKVVEIHRRYPDILLGADGGVTAQNILRFLQAGITRFCASSSIFAGRNPHTALEEMRKALGM
ncbi:hypothetical protein HYW18_00705 [Candidatus Uhrbacteria bacterium]|nr:hypothetical protein [Candidatus Uhrbacteria bacterium]